MNATASKATSETIKLHAYIAQLGYCSRRKAETLIEESRVKVNGQLAHLGQRVTPNQDTVEIDDQPLQSSPSEFVYYLINKPRGVVSTTSDELGRRTVLDLIPNLPTRVFIVGRLDKESEGLMLLTNDGDLAYRLTHPKFEVPKTYQVLVQGRPSLLALDHLRRGVKLKDGYTKPATVQILDTTDTGTWLEITISEGRYQQIRRMCLRIGYEVDRLIRVKLATYELDQVVAANKAWIKLEGV